MVGGCALLLRSRRVPSVILGREEKEVKVLLAALGCWLISVCFPGMIPSASAVEFLWAEDFEDTPVGELPPGWYSGGGSSDIGVDLAAPCEGDRALRLHGSVGGCWGGIASTPVDHASTSYLSEFTVCFQIRRGTENLSGCHPRYADLRMARQQTWENPPNSRYLVSIHEDGTVVSGSHVLGMVDDSCHTLSVTYLRTSATEVHLILSLDDAVPVLLSTAALSYEDQLTWFQWWAPEGTARFDDIVVSTPTTSVAEPGAPVSWGLIKSRYCLTGESQLDSPATPNIL